MANAKFKAQPLSKNAKFEEFGSKNAKLATLLAIIDNLMDVVTLSKNFCYC